MESRFNILFFLTPKEELAYIYEDSDLEQTLVLMESRRYTAIPVLRRSGEYLGTITEGDLLYGIKNMYQMNIKSALRLPIADLPRHSDLQAVTVSTDIEILFSKSLDQNFIPVIDDRGIFIGIVTRRKIIQYYRSKLDQAYDGGVNSQYRNDEENPVRSCSY